jgi:hypothetical protein
MVLFVRGSGCAMLKHPEQEFSSLSRITPTETKIYQSNLYGGLMSTLKRQPAFGKRINQDSYYENVMSIVNSLRPLSTLNVISANLNAANFTTPMGLPFTKQRVANFIRLYSTTKE